MVGPGPSCIGTLILKHDVCFETKVPFVAAVAAHAAVAVPCAVCGWRLLLSYEAHTSRGRTFLNLILATACSGILIVQWRLAEDGWGSSQGFSTAVNMLFVFLALMLADMVQMAFPLWGRRNKLVSALVLCVGCLVLYYFGLRPLKTSDPSSEPSVVALVRYTAGAFLVVEVLAVVTSHHHSWYMAACIGVTSMIAAAHTVEVLGRAYPPMATFAVSFLASCIVCYLVKWAWLRKAKVLQNDAQYGTFRDV